MSDGKLRELEVRLAKLSAHVRSELPERARALREAVRGLDGDEAAMREAIRRMAHQLRGTAGSHGMSELTDPAARVEELARTAPLPSLAERAHALADAIDAVARAPATTPPAAPRPPARKPSGASSPGLVRPLAGRRVLVIDDDHAMRRLLTMTLVNLGGATTRIEEKPAAFFAALEAEMFDAVIVDAMMPELNGLACLERIAGSPLARPGTRYFVLSAAAREELRWNLPSSLPVDWLRKPFRPKELLDALRTALG